MRRHQMCCRNFIQQQWSRTLWREYRVVGRQRGKLGLTRAQSKSTASRMSSWWPILDTPKSSSSWWVIRSSWSPPTFSLSKVLMYCCRQSSRPEGTTQNNRKTFSPARRYENFVLLAISDFLISCEASICIMCSNRAWYHFPCQNMCCKSLKCEHRLYFVMS